ncbi:MAG: NUDIX domain-containing protein [Minisyncoccia bacterium]
MSTETRPRVVLVNRSFVKRDDNKLLIIKRSPHDRYAPNKWEVPGGKLDSGQDLTHAQEREVLEETGLLVDQVERMAFVESYVIGEGPYTGLPYVAIFGITKVAGGQLSMSEEHSDYAWVSYNELFHFDLTYEVRKAAIVMERHLV